MGMIEGHRQIVPPAGVPSWDVDPFTPEVLCDPAPYFADLRARGELGDAGAVVSLRPRRYDRDGDR